LNVIDEREERNETLKAAWGYADKMLIASVMVAGESVIRQFKPYKDGVITKINTFQKYYSQSEIRSYLESTLGSIAIAVGQGIFVLFKDVKMEQDFLITRQQVKRDWQQLTQRVKPSPGKKVTQSTIEKNQELFDDFWGTLLDLGRPPANEEFEYTDQLRRVAKSNKQAFEAALKHYGENQYHQSKQLRKNDLLLYFALGLFEQRKPYIHMPNGLKRDVKAFFRNYKTAIQESTVALYSVGNPKLIEAKANEAYESMNTGEFLAGHSWIIHRNLIQSLPVELRIYVGCGTQLYGDIEEFDLVKIHFTSGKVSLMRFDDWSKEEPFLVERVKIKLRELDIDFFDYGDEYESPLLTNKTDFVMLPMNSIYKHAED
jgi:DNA phosphorothioation-associated putative methyltransferase